MRQRCETPRSCFSLARSDSVSAGSAIRSRRFSRSSQSSVRGGQSRTSKDSRQSPSCQAGRSAVSPAVSGSRSGVPASSGEAWRMIAKAKTARNPEKPAAKGGEGRIPGWSGPGRQRSKPARSELRPAPSGTPIFPASNVLTSSTNDIDSRPSRRAQGSRRRAHPTPDRPAVGNPANAKNTIRI